MKAVVFPKAKKLEVIDIEKPQISDEEVLVKNIGNCTIGIRM